MKVVPKPRKWRRRLKRLAAAVTIMAALSLGLLAAAWFLFPFPLERLDNLPDSPTVTDRDGRTLLMSVGPDDQWRFPLPLEELNKSPWLIKATIATEDKRFREHRGVDPWAVGRAAWQDVSSWRTVSGASTLTMQVCRMMDGRPRTLSAKAIEAFRALQLERLRSKDEILATYLNMAPYGRNVHGVEAAARYWFGKHARDLSLGESALLAGLPQSPLRYRPDRYPEAALTRRQTVLRLMLARGMISPEQRDQAAGEQLELARTEMQSDPRHSLAPHAAWLALARRPRGGQTTIDANVQADALRLAREHSARWPADTEASIVVIDVASGEILALVGSLNPADPRDGQTCGATAWRSPGSTLKPFVYAAAFETRRAGPDSTVYDIPIQRAGWSPNNFDGRFAGELPAADALRRSLNVPAILLAESVGLGRCIGLMRASGVQLRDGPEVHGGLAAVVGAVEVRLLDLVNAYATLARGGTRQAARLFADEASEPVLVIDRDVCAAVDSILSSRARRPAGLEALADDQVPWFMWKTGTSSGRRDAWAVGHNRRFAIGVWIGRFDGRGDPAFVGAEMAEPLIAQLFSLPRLRNDTDPPAPAGSRPWPVTCPLPRPDEIVAPVQITFPPKDSRFLALAGQAIIRPRVNTAGPRAALHWFLNGRLLDAEGSRDAAPRLLLPPGRYELRCVAPTGISSAVAFVVR